ncbi:MAG: glycosyltransferase, partial [Oscillospiraceae bacterium]
MEKIKVLMGIIRSNSGLSTYAVNLFRKMDKEAFDCTFLSNDPHPYFEQDIKDLGGHLEVIASRNRHPKQHLEDLRKIMRETKFDVCHIHLSSNSNICPIVEAKKAGIPIVIAHCHSTDVEGGGSFQRILHRINQKKLQKMDITRMACSKAAGKFAFGEAPFVVANNAIDVNQFDYSSDLREKMRDQLGLQNCFVVGQVGRLVPVKNHLYTLSLFQILQQKCPESRLLIVGDGALEQSLKQKTEEMGMQSKVLFVGSVRNPEAYFNAMD